MKIYWGITATRGYRDTIPISESVMISAGSLWKEKQANFMNKRTWQWPDFILDSGGFVALNKWGDYPYTPDQYLSLVERMNPSWAASMDYPCEPNIAKGTKLTIQERITATVENAVYLSSKDSRIVPVLQGYTAKEYEQCWNMLKGKMTIKQLAIGSVCKRQSTKLIGDLCWELRQFLPDIPIHGFGVKRRALDFPETWDLFTSIDTNAWEFYRRAQRWKGNKITDRQAFVDYQTFMAKMEIQPRQLCL